jgi:hypothetical protein
MESEVELGLKWQRVHDHPLAVLSNQNKKIDTEIG